MTKGHITLLLAGVGIVAFYCWLTWHNAKPPETQEEFDSAAIRSMECYVFSEIAIVGAEPNLVLGPDHYRQLSDIFKFYYDKYADEAGWSKQKKSSAERAHFSVLKDKDEFEVAKTLCYIHLKFLN